MPIAAVGLSHRTAPVDIRERFAFGRDDIPPVLDRLLTSGVADEAVLLSTCNRTEFYLSLPDVGRGQQMVQAVLAEHAGERVEQVKPYLYTHRGLRAVEHLFRVTSGLESMILGEPQIQGQVKEAYQAAQEVSCSAGPVVGATLNRVFQTALSVGGRVRSETEVGLGATSVSTAAVDLAKKIFGSLKDKRVLILGAGEMSEITLECLRAEGVRSSVVANRTYERARELARRWGGDAVRFDEFRAMLPTVDIVIASTAASQPVLTRDQLRAVLPQGPRGPLCMIDIAIPRDVEPSIGNEQNVFLYNIDDLRQIVDDNLGRRRAEIPRAEALIAEGAEDFWSWYTTRAVVPTIRDLRERSEDVRRLEVEKALRKLAHLAPEDQAAIDAMTRTLLNKLLHSPTVRLREAAGNGRGPTVLDTLRYLFELDAEEGDVDVEPATSSTDGKRIGT